MKVAFLPANRRFFYKKMFIQVEQMSVSPEAYDFWLSIQKQKETGSDLFQTPPPRTTGNIITKTQGAIQAAGIFSAASIKRRSLFIDRSEIPNTMPPIDTLAIPCRESYKNSTSERPSFW
jgi:hypothetical protein